VPFILYDNQSQGSIGLKAGSFRLSNIAATIVNLLGYEAPEMWDPGMLQFK